MTKIRRILEDVQDWSMTTKDAAVQIEDYYKSKLEDKICASCLHYITTDYGGKPYRDCEYVPETRRFCKQNNFYSYHKRPVPFISEQEMTI